VIQKMKDLKRMLREDGLERTGSASEALVDVGKSKHAEEQAGDGAKVLSLSKDDGPTINTEAYTDVEIVALPLSLQSTITHGNLYNSLRACNRT
jgi:hypothetical protein